MFHVYPMTRQTAAAGHSASAALTAIAPVVPSDRRLRSRALGRSLRAHFYRPALANWNSKFKQSSPHRNSCQRIGFLNIMKSSM